LCNNAKILEISVDHLSPKVVVKDNRSKFS
jgi:hypothetical protein